MEHIEDKNYLWDVVKHFGMSYKFRGGSIRFFTCIYIAQTIKVNYLKKIHLQEVSLVSMLIFLARLNWKGLPGVMTLMRLTRMSWTSYQNKFKKRYMHGSGLRSDLIQWKGIWVLLAISYLQRINRCQQTFYQKRWMMSEA